MTTTTEKTTQERLQEMCDHTAKIITEGYDYCRECGHEDDTNQDHDGVCPECGDEDYGYISGWDYLSDVLDIKYIINSDKTYNSARILVAFGGPNIWVDTETMTVEGYWWSDRATARFADNIGLDSTLEEMYEMDI